MPEPYQYRAIWGVPAHSRYAFDLLVARQLIWLAHAKAAVRQLLFTEDEQPICPACSRPVTTGTPSVMCVALLADRELQQLLARDPAAFASKEPSSEEAWWLTHGSCFDQLTPERRQRLDQRIELALRADTRTN
ncbi:MAG: hypothetical protein HY534_06700 [Chloroflexi bacterium]|nr:hypothetical protein [Chloroflexota bacterium]